MIRPSIKQGGRYRLSIYPTNMRDLRRMSEGYSLKEIAADRGVAWETIASAVYGLKATLGSRSLYHLIASLVACDLVRVDSRSDGSDLTDLDRDVLSALADGARITGTQDSVEKRLSVGPHTALYVTKDIRKILRARNTTHAIAMAASAGWIDVTSHRREDLVDANRRFLLCT